MNVGIVSAGGGQNVMVRRGIGNLLANIDDRAIDDGVAGSVHQTVDERGVGILINLLDSAVELVGRLSPVVILHRDYEDRLNIFGSGGETAQGTDDGECTNGAETCGL